MLCKIVVPRVSLGNRTLRLLLANVGCIVLSVLFNSKVLASLPGKLQALAIQANRRGYIYLATAALGFRFIYASEHLRKTLLCFPIADLESAALYLPATTYCATWAGHELCLEWQGDCRAAELILQIPSCKSYQSFDVPGCITRYVLSEAMNTDNLIYNLQYVDKRVRCGRIYRCYVCTCSG
eukprot:SAG31_NODE_249_length_19118_cov_47.456195_16_plen_182_part_00